jgi:hypothetical protein
VLAEVWERDIVYIALMLVDTKARPEISRFLMCAALLVYDSAQLAALHAVSEKHP